MKVITYFDKNRIQWAPILIESLLINEPKTHVIVNCVNLSKDETKEIAKYENVILRRNIIKKGKFIETLKPQYIINAVKTVQDVSYVYIEPESIVIKPLVDVEGILEKCDFAGYRPTIDEVNTSFLMFKKNEMVLNFLDYWDNALNDGIYTYYKEALALADAVDEYKTHGLVHNNLMDIGQKYSDMSYRKDSYIWKGTNGSIEVLEMKLQSMKG